MCLGTVACLVTLTVLLCDTLRIHATIVSTVVGVLCAQILWNESMEQESDHAAAAVQYHRRFSAHFQRDPAHSSGKYQPTIVCYIEKDKVLQVGVSVCYAIIIVST